MEDKKAIVNDVFEKFHDRFGFYPESTGSYYMDADLTNYIKEKYPMVNVQLQHAGRRALRHTTHVTTHGTHSSTEAHGHHGFHQSRTHMRQQQIRKRIAES